MSNVIAEAELGFPPLPSDEYDAYLTHLLTLLSSGASDPEAYAYLEIVEREYLGLSSPAGDKIRFLAALRDWH